jgi:transcriptional regulator with XRE-family HTH domain
MNQYAPVMALGDRVKKLRKERAMTQEDLVARSGLALATIQRAERGERLSADTIASLAAAFDLQAIDLTCAVSAQDDQPYLPLETISTGRRLVRLIGCSQSLDFGFVELTDLEQAELVEQLQAWCTPLGPERVPSGAVGQVRIELEATQLLRGMAERGLLVTGASFTVTAYEVDDDCGAGQPILMGQWDYVRGVLRVGTKDEMIDRAYVMEGLGKWENPGSEVIFPPQPDTFENWITGADVDEPPPVR